jgi:hypothetical protein
MTTISRPVIYDEVAIGAGDITADDTNITGDQWSRLWVRDGGVDSGMALTLSAVSDTATVSTGVGVWRGFILTVSAAHNLTLPAVTSAKTYSVGVLFDPANYSTDAGPLSLAVFDKATITIPSGGAFWTLWEVDRLPATVLNASVVRTYRHGRGTPVIWVSTLPVPSQYTFGQVAITTTGAVYVRDAPGGVAAWSQLTDDTGEVTTGVIAASGWSNPGTSYQTKNGITTVHLRATRTGAAILSGSSSGSLSDVAVLTLPSAARPRWLETGRGTVTLADGGTQGFDWRVSTAGVMTLTSANPNISIAAGSVLYAGFTFIR